MGVLFLVFLSAGCGQSGTNENRAPGFLEGTVTIGPLCPVEPCQISPEQLAAVYAARKVIVYNSDRTSVIKERSLDQNGRYSAELEVGKYIVDIKHVGIDRSPDVPTAISIEPGKTVTLNIGIDTGIR